MELTNVIKGSSQSELLALKAVSRTFDGSHPVEALRDVDLSIGRAEVLGVVGRSGSGKSTLLNVLGLLDTFSEGRYEISGISVSDASESCRTELRAAFFGFVFQQSFLLPRRTAEENIEVALLPSGIARGARRRRAQDALNSVGLAERRNFFPSMMSGGENQRVAIARAIAQEPSVLLCDEPTGNLDERSAEDILSLLLDQARRGIAVVLVTHDLSIARRLPRLVSVRDGHLEEGLSPSVLARSGPS